MKTKQIQVNASYNAGESSANSFMKNNELSSTIEKEQINFNKEDSKFAQRNGDRRNTLKGLEKADFEKAVENVTKISNRYYKGQQVGIGVDLEHFRMYGPGIYLFFTFVKYMSILFLILAGIYLIPVIYNVVSGTSFSNASTSLGVYLAKSTVANLNDNSSGSPQVNLTTSRNNKLFNCIPDMVASLLFLAFYLFWEVRSDKLTQQIKQTIKFQSFSTVELTKFPKDVTEKQIHDFFSQFGQVTEVAPVKQYDDLIYISKQIYELELKHKELKLSYEAEVDLSDKKKIEEKLKELSDSIHEKQNQLQMEIKESNDNVMKYFIVFKDMRVRQEVVCIFNKYSSWCGCLSSNDGIPSEHKMNGGKFTIKVSACHNEPGDIIWQNQHITKWNRLLRKVIQFVFLIILIVIVFGFISVLNIMTPKTSSTIDTSSYSAATILTQSNSLIVQSWCLLNTGLMSSNSQIKSLCTVYQTRYYIKIAIGVAISLVCVAVKAILKIIVVKLAKFQRYKEYTEQSIDMIENLFYTYICTTALITMLLQANFLGISFKYILRNIITDPYLLSNMGSLTQYKDFDPYWYVDIGYQIFFTWVILAFQVPVVNPILACLMEKFNYYRARKQLIQKNAETLITPDQFEIQDHYANMLLIIFVGFAFSGGMPVIIIPCAIAFGARYFYFKLVFLRYSKVPKSLDDAINERILNFLPFALLFHYFFGVWMYGSQSIFVAETNFTSTWITSDSSVAQFFGAILARFGNSWYFSICFCVTLAVIILKTIFYDIIFENLRAKRDDTKIPSVMLQTKMNDNDPSNDMGIISERSLTHSYRIENNPDYFEVLAIMDKMRQLKINSLRQI